MADFPGTQLLKSSLAVPKFQAICSARIPVTALSAHAAAATTADVPHTSLTLREAGKATEQQGLFLFQLSNPNPWVAEEDSSPAAANLCGWQPAEAGQPH